MLREFFLAALLPPSVYFENIPLEDVIVLPTEVEVIVVQTTYTTQFYTRLTTFKESALKYEETIHVASIIHARHALKDHMSGTNANAAMQSGDDHAMLTAAEVDLLAISLDLNSSDLLTAIGAWYEAYPLT